ncbi:cupin domain-containing protein [Kiloniella sp.]|uniref:cupin domain-containing protein n=1 Tax=Kiloniella sp. TaxID=1938587 RepID=UPI003B0263F3
MRSILLFLLTPLMLVSEIATGTAAAHETDKEVIRQLIIKESLTNIPGHNLTALTVQLPPGNVSPAHKHDAFVFVHVLAGNVRSQLDNAEAIDYSAGDSWVEPPGSVHTLTQNLSNKEIAKLLVIFVRKDGDKLTTSGPTNQ